MVQVRQRVPHKRTFFFIEQLLLKHNTHSDSVNIVSFRDGIDFYFIEKNQALRFIDFLEGNVPMKTKYSRKLVSADHTSNIGNFKHNFICDVAPICRDDLVIIPKLLAKNLSDISQLLLVRHVAAGIHVIDPFTCERQEVNTEKYWRYSFPSIMNSRQLIRYVVLSIEPILPSNRPTAKKRGVDRKLRLAECILARERDFGVNDTQFTCVTHLGHLLKEGDVALGYDLSVASWVHEVTSEDFIPKGDLPDVILVRKHYPTKSERIWALKSLQADEKAQLTSREQELEERDYEEFLQELESDKELRAQINLYKSSRGKGMKKSSMGEEGMEGIEEGVDEPDEEEIRLEELLDDLMVSEGVEGDGVVILSTEEAQSVEIGGTVQGLKIDPFDAASFSPKDFKF